jgi:hypothetical protein
MKEFIKNNFLIFNLLFLAGLFLLTLFGFAHITNLISESGKAERIFSSQTIPLQVREAARKDLQQNLKGAKLSKVNRDSLNLQLLEVGLYVDDSSTVQIMSDEEFERLRKQRYEDMMFSMKAMLHNEQTEYQQGESSTGYGLLAAVQNINSSNLSVAEEEEEEEEAADEDYQDVKTPIPDYSDRVDYRQKQLKSYINSTLKESIIKARKEEAAQAKKKGKSKSLQEQLGISDVSSLFKPKK